MKLLKQKKIPAKMLVWLFDSYNWGFEDSKQSNERKSFEEFKTSINRGFKEGLTKKKV